MRILFMRHPMPHIGGTGTYTMELIHAARAAGCDVGLWPSAPCVFAKALDDLGVTGYPFDIPDIPRCWDVLVLQNQFPFAAGAHILQHLGDLPHVFLSHSSSWENQVLPYQNLYRLITIAESLIPSHQRWGIPCEFIDVLCNPIRFAPAPGSYTRPTGTFHIVHVSRLHPEKTSVIAQVIAAANRMRDCRLTIIGDGPPVTVNMLKRCANANVTFAGEQHDPTPYVLEADLVIGSGRAAVEAMAASRPVLVLGARGFGGLVTPDSYPDLKRRMFAGRNGGALYERLDPEALVHEIRKVLLEEQLERIVADTYALARRDFATDQIRGRFLHILARAVDLHRQLGEDATTASLKPCLVSNCRFERADDAQYALVRAPFDNVISRMPAPAMRVVQAFDGTRTLDDLYADEAPPYDRQALIRQVRTLWKAKTIFFDDAPGRTA